MRINAGLGEHRGKLGGFRHEIDKLLLNHVADHADRLGADHVERIHRHFLVGVVLQRQQADLRAIAVRNHEFVAFIGLGNLLAGDADVGALIFAAHRFAALEKGIAAESNNKTHFVDFLEIYYWSAVFLRQTLPEGRLCVHRETRLCFD